MRQLVTAIKDDNDTKMADLFRSMVRLWPDTPGLRKGRLAEAALIEQADTPVKESDLLKITL
jgi:hypothetical protein